ncbi:MAG: hypothetical protein JXA93_21950 [Anaerolineae bacterium]|nr:hypothetical protein [Anaerolineae bacterium]
MQFRPSRLAWVLLALIVVLLLVAAGSAAAFFLLRPQETVEAAWRDPISAILPDQVAPDLALYPLAGASELDTIDAAISNDQVETAYAAIVLSTDLSDAQRLGRLILLGSAMLEGGATERAALVYQQVYDIAILSPWLSDPARADALLASGHGWRRVGEVEQALAAYDQVYLIAVGSPYLQMANRRSLLVALEAAYDDMGDKERAPKIRAKIIELDQQAGPLPPLEPGLRPELSAGEQVISSPELGLLEDARRQAALGLLQTIAEQGQPQEELVAALAGALRAEDTAKGAFYQQALAETAQPGRRVDIHRAMIRWLSIKYKVAARGFGLSLVPEWEEDVATIQSALSRSYQDLFFEYEDLVTALPDATLMVPGRYQIRRQALLQGRLGHYVNYPAQQWAEKLQSTVQELVAAGGGDRLYVDVEAREDGTLDFFLTPAAEYGSPAP